MTLTTIRTSVYRLIALVQLSIASFFSRNLDALLGEFASLDARLDRFIDQQNARLDRISDGIDASLARVRQVKAAERSVRDQLYADLIATSDGRERARRVQERLRTLLD